MKKIILILLTFFIFSNCGYNPIYSNKNLNFNLIKITKTNNNQLNSRIEKRLKNFSSTKSQKQISVEINAQKKIVVVSRDLKGDPSRFEMKLKTIINIIYNDNENLEKEFNKSFSYNSNSNKFALNQYQREVEELLIDKIIEDLIKYLSQI